MFFEIRQLGRRIVERLREALEALPLSGPWQPVPAPVPVKPQEPTKPARRWHGARFVALGIALGVAGTTVGGQADDSVETPCAICRVWDTSMHGVPAEQVVLEGHALENGVVLRATSPAPEVQAALWSMSSQRQELLVSLHQGLHVPLCASCTANLHAFEELRIEAVRLPDGVLLLYTSAQPEIVRRLHDMVTGTGLIL